MDLRLTLISKSFALQSEFYEQFSDFDKISIASDFPSHPDKNHIAALVVPCSNAYGHLDFGMTSVSKVLTIEQTTKIKQIIFDNHRGEQPALSSILIEGNPLFPFICWTALGRVRSALASDFAYAGLWSAFSAIHNYNLNERKKPGPDKKYITRIYLPDFSEYINSEATEQRLLKDFVRQMGLAIKTWILNEIHDVPNLENAEKRHKQIVTVQVVSRQEIETTLMGLLYQLSGDILSRGLCNQTELEILIHWIEENGKHTSICAETLAGLMKRPDTEFALKRSLIIETALKSKTVLSIILDLASKGTIQLHQEIRRSDVVPEANSIMGQGTVGTVSVASWNGTRVAVKGFISADDKSAKEFGREISLLSLIQHSNIVSCFGASTDPKDLFIVEELMLANLFEVLHDTNLPLSQSMKLNFASGVASGMRHLHRCHLIHRDLKSLNVLVGVNFEVKICDFGLSRFCDKTSNSVMTNNIGTVCWVAPEIFARKAYNEKADVYSFAIVFWEILTRQQPFGNTPSFSVPMLVMKGDRPSIPKEIPREWARLIQKCWGKKAAVRPSFEEICSTIKGFKMDLASTLQHAKSSTERPRQLSRDGKEFTILFMDGSKPLTASDSAGSFTKTGSWSDSPNYPCESSGSSQDSPGIKNMTNAPNRSDSWSDGLLIASETPREMQPPVIRARSGTYPGEEEEPPATEPADSLTAPLNQSNSSSGLPIKKRLKVTGKDSSSEEQVSKTRKRLNRHPSMEQSGLRDQPRRKDSGSKGNNIQSRRGMKSSREPSTSEQPIAEEKEPTK